MNWGRAKTILIILFLATDLFLLIILVRTKTQFVRIPETTIQETVTIMQNHGIQIDPGQISNKRVKNRSMIMQNYFQDPNQTAYLFLGVDSKILLSDPEQYMYQYESPLGKLDIQGNGFAYVSKKTITPFREDPLPGAEQVSDSVAESLKKLGFQKGSFVFDNIREQEGLYYLDAHPVSGNTKIYGITMHITADSEGIININGHWFVPVETEENEPEMLLDVTTILTELTLKKAIQPMKIEKVCHAYYASDDFLSSRELAAVPVYVFEDDAGNEYMFDARVGAAVE